MPRAIRTPSNQSRCQTDTNRRPSREAARCSRRQVETPLPVCPCEAYRAASTGRTQRLIFVLCAHIQPEGCMGGFGAKLHGHTPPGGRLASRRAPKPPCCRRQRAGASCDPLINGRHLVPAPAWRRQCRARLSGGKVALCFRQNEIPGGDHILGAVEAGPVVAMDASPAMGERVAEGVEAAAARDLAV
eukprot:7293290-Prymnesium_polylepis.1